jgi:hypothetical protein
MEIPMAKKPVNPTQTEEFPRYCDYSCRYSDFADPSVVGACRREVGVWCGKAKQLHGKHTRCLFRPIGDEDEARSMNSD